MYFTRTPYYDKIVKDTSAKFVDMLSAIGGTTGLLTSYWIFNHQCSGNYLLCS